MSSSTGCKRQFMRHKQTLMDKQETRLPLHPDVQTNLSTLCDTWRCNALLKSWLIDRVIIVIIAGDSEIADTHLKHVLSVCNQCVIDVCQV